MKEVSEPAKNPNVNCLAGKRCPSCGSYGPFEVVATMWVLLYDNGTDDSKRGSAEYDDNAQTECCECGHEGIFGEFDE
jgi:hypothetical protein